MTTPHCLTRRVVVILLILGLLLTVGCTDEKPDDKAASPPASTTPIVMSTEQVRQMLWIANARDHLAGPRRYELLALESFLQHVYHAHPHTSPDQAVAYLREAYKGSSEILARRHLAPV